MDRRNTDVTTHALQECSQRKIKREVPQVLQCNGVPTGWEEGMLSNPKALEAIKKEWRGLHRQYVFDMENVKEMDNVRAEAKRLGVVVHFARVHGLMNNYPMRTHDESTSTVWYYWEIK